MAHFAEIDSNNIVQRVIVVHDSLESTGAEWCHDRFGGTWLQTSYNGRIRKNFAGIGYKYRADIDAFVPPQPFSSWTLNEQTAQWVPPVPYPQDNAMYQWDEQTGSWLVVFMP